MAGFHHRSAFGKQKKFKSKSKGKQKRLQKGRVDEPCALSTQGPSGKAFRTNLSKQLRNNKLEKNAIRRRLGHESVQDPPKIIALLPMHERADMNAARSLLIDACGADEKTLPASGPITLEGNDGSKGFRITIISAQSTMLSMLDAAKVADVVVPVVCPFHSTDPRDAYGVDERSDAFVSAIKAQGMPAVLALAQGLELAPAKRQHLLKKTCVRYVHTLFDESVKVLSSDAPTDVKTFLRMLFNVRLKELPWRSQRAYLLVDSARAVVEPSATEGTLVLTGFVRGQGIFSPNHLVHLTGHGDFQLDRIDYQNRSRKKSSMEMMNDGGGDDDDFQVLEADPMLQRPSLNGLRDIDPLAHEQSIITEEELREADERAAKRRTLRRKQELVAQGVPEYKAAWEAVLPSDDDDDEQDDQDQDMMDTANGDGDGDGDDHAALALKFRMEREEMEFPDEVDTPLDRLAKDRFQRYRGLKSFSESPWDPKENLPLEYSRIVEFETFEGTRNRVVAAGTSTSSASSSPIVAGTRVALYVRAVPVGVCDVVVNAASNTVVSALFEHERSVSVCHYKIRRSASYSDPVKGKQNQLWNVGFRRFEASAIFSSFAPKCNKQKVERFLHPQRFSVASMYARVTFGPANVLALRPDNHWLIASGSLLNADPDRVCVKRIVLTGYPIRVQKRKAVVRYMFFTPEDVRWFQPVALSTKYGLVGQIDGPIGVHGYFKCNFNGFIKPHDTVCVVLYKRQFPPWDASKFDGNL